MNKIELFIDWFKWINYEKHFIDVENEVSWVRTDLFFNNYILQSKFDKLLKKLWLSIFLSYTNFDIELYRDRKFNIEWDITWITSYKNIKYWFQRKKSIDLYLEEDIVFKKNIEIWTEIFWNSIYKYEWILELRVVTIHNIKNIKCNFDDYIVLFFEHDLNLYIPHVYKFKYFLSFNKLEDLAHYSIIFKEIWAKFIDSIWTWNFYWLEDNYLLEVDFNTWLIKRIW
jgi:hypothetical protein